uniref:Uncharacterized protein n=1 Tax=Canis lupus familiaris TaxID=9615 RepID=A0A8C0M1T5_CANLF
MKGTLLVLTLLVTQDLGIEMACPLFYSVFGTLAIGKELPLNTALRLANATEAEKAAMGKIQDCYNEKGLDAKILDLILLRMEGSCRFYFRNIETDHLTLDRLLGKGLLGLVRLLGFGLFYPL